MKYIMLHGLGQSSESWSDTVKVFNDDFEVLCPNLSDWLFGKIPCYDTLYRTLETYIFHTASVEYQTDSNQGNYQEADKFGKLTLET